MTDPVRRARLGAAARALVEANRGAKDKTLAVLDALLPPQRRAYPANVRPFRAVLGPRDACWTCSTDGSRAPDVRWYERPALGQPSPRRGR